MAKVNSSYQGLVSVAALAASNRPRDVNPYGRTGVNRFRRQQGCQKIPMLARRQGSIDFTASAILRHLLTLSEATGVNYSMLGAAVSRNDRNQSDLLRSDLAMAFPVNFSLGYRRKLVPERDRQIDEP